MQNKSGARLKGTDLNATGHAKPKIGKNGKNSDFQTQKKKLLNNTYVQTTNVPPYGKN